MTSVLSKDHYEKFKAFERDYLNLENDINSLKENIKMNKNTLNKLDQEISPIVNSLSSEKNLRLPLSSQKGLNDFSKDKQEAFRRDMENLSSQFGNNSKSLISRAYYKARNMIKALGGIIFNLDKVYYNSLYNARLLDHYREWIQYSITEIQDNLFIQQDINQNIATLLTKMMLLVQKFNEVSIDHTLISELKQKGFDTKIDLLRNKEKMLMDNLMQEESFREYFHKIENYKKNINGLILKINEIMENMAFKSDRAEISQVNAERILNDQVYYEFEEAFRGDRNKIKINFQQYIDMVRERQPVVDIGCGRGEFLEVLQENNIESWGVDSNPCMTEMCLKDDIKIYNRDALSYLKKAEDESIGTIFSSHLLEHMTISQIEHFLRQSYRALRKNGLVIIETLDPSSFIGFHYYYLMDPTHKTPIHPQYIRFLADSIGFEDAFIYRPAKDYDRVVSDSLILNESSSKSSNNTIEAFKYLSEKLGNYPEFSLIAKKGR